MANGYKPGDSLAQFLNQLPQIYRAKQNIDLQRERLQYMKEEGFKDEIYRAQVLTANEQTNKLARQEFEEKQQQNLYAKEQREFNNNLQTDANERADFQLEAAVFKPGTKAYNTWVLNSKMVKEAGPVVEGQIRDSFAIEDDLTDRLRSTVAMNPLDGLEEIRKISLNTNLNEEHFKLIQTLRKQFQDAAEVTQTELEAQPSYKNLKNERILLQEARESGPMRYADGTLESLDDYRKRVSNITLNMQSYEKDVMEEARSAQGVYPGLSIPFYEKFPMNEPMYDNIDDIPDTEVDEVLSGLGAPAIESNALPPEFAPPERPTTPPQMYTEDSLGVPADVEAVAPEDATLLTPAYDFSGFSSEDMKKYGTQIFFDKDTNRWYDLQTMEPATISQIKRHQGKDKPKKLSANQKNNINRIVKQMAQLKTRTYDKKILEGKINRLKNKILNIDPNYKFKD